MLQPPNTRWSAATAIGHGRIRRRACRRRERSLPIPLVWSDAHAGHAPTLQTVDGQTHPHPERPERPDLIRAALVAAGLVDAVAPEPSDPKVIGRVHDPAYVAFIRDVCAEIPDGRQVTPTGVSHDAQVLEQRRLEDRLSYYAFGLDAPLTHGTFDAARSAVDVALTGARLISAGASHALALCRPPGHHAEHARMGGFCYFNNAVLAANDVPPGECVAILDIDYHHGNGSQQLTYARDDRLYVSLHADPSYAYPGFSGRREETGDGAGAGWNHNFPLPPHTAIDAYLAALDQACEIVAAAGPSRLIVSLGFDTHRDDPIATFDLRSEDFGRVGARIAQLGVPAVHVLEGGYALARLGESAVAYVEGLGAAPG